MHAYSKEKENLGRKIKRSECWKKGHEKSDGTVLESAKELYKLVTEAEEKRLESYADDGLDSDELVEVFGPDKKGLIRGVGTHITKKQLEHVDIACEVLEQKNSSLEADVAYLKTKMEVVLQHVSNGSQVPHSLDIGASIPRNDIGSFSGNKSPVSSFQNGTPNSSQMSDYKVMLLDGEGTSVVKGFVVNDSTRGICHGRKVLLGEKKVYVEEVMIGDAPLYGEHRDGNGTMQDFIEGGYLVWLEPRLQRF